VRGGEVCVSARSREKAEVLLELGIETAGEGDEDFDVVVDAVGSRAFERSLKLVRRNGVVVIGNVTSVRALIRLGRYFFILFSSSAHMSFRVRPWAARRTSRW
jgi:alcohol dehydrogenase